MEKKYAKAERELERKKESRRETRGFGLRKYRRR